MQINNFIKYVQIYISNLIVADDADPDINLESQYTEARIKNLLVLYNSANRGNNDKVIVDDNNPFVLFLRERENIISGTKAKNVTTRANLICKRIDELLCSASKHTKKKSKKIIYTKSSFWSESRGTIDSTDKFKTYVNNIKKSFILNDNFSTRDHLINELLCSSKNNWSQILAKEELSDLINCFTDDKGSMMTDLLIFINSNNLYDTYENHNIAILYILFTIYQMDRSLEPEKQFKSMISTVFSAFTPIIMHPYSLEDKKSAVSAVLNYLTLTKSLNTFNDELNNEEMSLSKHKGALLQGTLAVFTAQITIAENLSLTEDDLKFFDGIEITKTTGENQTNSTIMRK